MELRKIVDEMMRHELDLLQVRLFWPISHRMQSMIGCHKFPFISGGARQGSSGQREEGEEGRQEGSPDRQERQEEEGKRFNAGPHHRVAVRRARRERHSCQISRVQHEILFGRPSLFGSSAHEPLARRHKTSH